MHKYEAAVLKALTRGKALSLESLLSSSKLKKEEALWAIENLVSREAISITRHETETIELTEEGRSYEKSGLPEEGLAKKLYETGKADALGSLQSVKNFNIAFPWAKKNGWIEHTAGQVRLTSLGEEIATGKKAYEYRKILESIAKSKARLDDKEAIENLKRRNLIEVKKRSEISSVKITEKGLKEIEKGERTEQIDAVNKSMILGRSWSGKEFKPYDVNVPVDREPIAMRHPIRKTINQIKQTYLSLGFKQVSGPIIEPAFWVFDSLFVPQDHPARDVQDTFYLSNPERISLKKEESVERIKKAHLEAWGGEWETETAEQALLRTHTTNISVRYMTEILRNIKMGKDGYQLPLKLFSVGRVFRNENIDYRHLTDFYQHEGIVIGNNLTLANLFHILVSIYKNLGLEVKFKPSYFPFVEPGVEFYAYSERSKEWMEMGGAGVIRREVTGVPRKNITVLAWGPGLERIILVKDPSIKSITELYNNDLGWLRQRRMVQWQ